MKSIKILTVIILIALLFTNCKNNQSIEQANNLQDTAAIKAELIRIFKIQDDAIAQRNEEGNRKFAATCMDSLMFVNDGQLTISSVAISHDLISGEIKIPHNTKFQFYNNTVLVSNINKMYELDGRDTLFYYGRNTTVWIKENNQWKMAYLGYSPIPVNYFKPGKSNPAVYSNYVGIYQKIPSQADTILLINGNLYSRANTDSERIKLFATNDSTFTSNDWSGKIIFSRDATGKVTQQIFEQLDGQQIRIPKVK